MTVRVGACLSLSGRYARFGAQAGQALRVWQYMTDGVEVLVEDDRGSARTLREILPGVADHCDLLLGPYSTHLSGVAADVAARHGLVMWNHGGGGDDVQTGRPGQVVSVPTVASRYAEPFVRYLAAEEPDSTVWILPGGGGFGRQVGAGANRVARRCGVSTAPVEAVVDLPVDVPGGTSWNLFTAGSFDEDVRTVNHARNLPFPPGVICAVAAGVSEFGTAVAVPDGIFGVAQWIPGHDGAAEIGPEEGDFVARFARVHGHAPEYPAVQAVAAAALATHCAHEAGSTEPAALWSAATALDTRTLFGPFRIDPHTGAQLGHGTVLVRWQGQSGSGPTSVQRHEVAMGDLEPGDQR